MKKESINLFESFPKRSEWVFYQGNGEPYRQWHIYQLRHTNLKTTVDFYIGSDVDYQREMIEKLILNSGKIVGKDEISGPAQLPTA